MSEQPDTKNNRKLMWRLLTIATVVVLVTAGLNLLLAPVREGKRLEQSLLDQFGSARDYTPPADGRISPERIEKFIRVRQALRSECRDYQAILDSLIVLESLDSEVEMSDQEKASRGIDGFKSLFSAAPNMLEFMEARNSSLLVEEMGLGEYFYLYIAAYGQRLAEVENSAYAEMDEAHISPRAREAFTRMLENQLSAIERSQTITSKNTLVQEISAEIDALNTGVHASPWPRGPGGHTRESLSAWSEQLDELYCEGMVRLELLQKNKGFNFSG